MRRKTVIGLVALAMFCWSSLALAAAADGPDKTKKGTQRVEKGAGTPIYTLLNINNMWTWARADGQSNHSPQGNDGAFFPRGTSWVIYQDGFVWGGKAFLDAARTQPAPNQVIRIGGATYNVGTRAGAIIGSGATATAESPAAPDVRIYRIRRDYDVMSEEELRRDAAEYYEIPISDVTSAQMQAIKEQYAKDWAEWPVAKGAPYIERNGTPGFQRPPSFSATFTVDDLISGNYDEPGLAGSDPNSPADQVIWTVFNDLDRTATLGLYGAEPMGMEVQMTLWGYKRTDAMGNLYFKKYKIINKGGVDIGGGQKGSFWIDSMYVAQWSDPDLGSFGDDLSGSDSLLSLGYVYNGNAIDSEFRKFNLPPPAVGYDFLQGPIVPAPGDSAVFNLRRRYGYRNLPMTSFAWFAAGSDITDPQLTNYDNGALPWWRMLRGFRPDRGGPERFYPVPPGFSVTKFPLSGDPTTRTGFIDGLGTAWSFPPGDRRIVLSSGPFVMAPGDTQEVVVGTVAGLGSDRLSSISVMKFNDRFVQNTYDALFQVPSPPAAPDVKVAELDGEVVLEWGSNLARLADTEGRINQPGAYKFEGYNVYQLPSPGSRLSDGVRIATYDLTTDPTVVLDEQFDIRSGQILRVPVQFGTNSGILRYFRFNRDYIRDIDKIYNGQEYYLAVTAYSVSTIPDYLPAALESAPQVLSVRPKVPFGKVYQSKHGDTLKVTHVSGRSDGKVRPIVINPVATTGNTYEVRFDVTAGRKTWRLVNKTTGANVLTGQTNESGDDNYQFVEGGIYLKVEGPPPGLKREDVFSSDDQSQWGWAWDPGRTAGGTSRFLTWVGGDFGWEGFRGAAGWGSARSVFGDGTMFVPSDQLKAVEFRFTPTSDNLGTFDPNHADASYAYRYGRAFALAPARPEFAPFIVNPAGGYSYQDYTISAPLAVYDIDATPPRRLAIGFLENNVAGGSVNGRYWPPTLSGDNIGAAGPREWLWVFDETYTGATPNPVNQTELISGNQRVMYYITWTRRNDNPWPAGQKLTLYPTRPNTPSDIFEYTTPPPAAGPDLEKASADNIGVFPNPYYGFNPAETSRLVRFVTFNNLPPRVTVRIFNLAGQLVRTLRKDSDSQFLRWDLTNEYNFPVASGIYLAHIEATLPTDGSTFTKVLKVAIIQEQEVLDVF